MVEIRLSYAGHVMSQLRGGSRVVQLGALTWVIVGAVLVQMCVAGVWFRLETLIQRWLDKMLKIGC